MKIVVTGGGSGGHITPLLAVAHEIKRENKATDIIYIGQKGDGLADIPAQDENIDSVRLIHAGKLRRYHGEGWKQLLDIPTVLKNIRDMFLVIIGFWQSFWLLRKLRPDVIFIKGGFVCVPVGLAAALLHIPYITHDSDALPGLANRIVAPWAKYNTVALPKEIYSYPQDKTINVGVPLSHHFRPFTAAEMADAKQSITGDPKSRILLVTGGGLGAKRINDAVISCAEELLDRYPDLTIVHVTGRNLEAKVRQQYKKKLNEAHQKRVIILGYTTSLHTYSGAAEVVIARAGATSIAEYAAQQKACIIVPNPILAGGHQLKNAQVLADRAAVKLLPEDRLKQDPHALMPPLVDLMDNPQRAQQLGQTLGALTQADSAKRLAMLLLEVAA
jgi:UDP-N-acetylglucosamine--N-acetylmuramyl-(pentapeptide) pyrophosphoryl-undecaprenol N-acetylglucosamine transferase